MDSVFGIVGDGFVLVAADRAALRQPLVFKHDEDKVVRLDDTKIVAAAGENCDRVAFTELIVRNIALDKFRSKLSRSCKATAHYIRGEAPMSVNLLLAGVDVPATEASTDSKDSAEAGKAAPAPAGEPSLYWIDYMGTMAKVGFGAHGYCAYFTNGLLDRYWKAGMSEEEGKALMGRCIGETRARFMLNQPNFICYMVTAAGVSTVDIDVPVMPDVSVAPAPAAPAAAAAAATA
ncbi:PBD2 [Symbiodinium sp. KB8]|nr:PBD2 [Symbiodinium sp. KB8]